MKYGFAGAHCEMTSCRKKKAVDPDLDPLDPTMPLEMSPCFGGDEVVVEGLIAVSAGQMAMGGSKAETGKQRTALLRWTWECGSGARAGEYLWLYVGMS